MIFPINHGFHGQSKRRITGMGVENRGGQAVDVCMDWFGVLGECIREGQQGVGDEREVALGGSSGGT